MRSIRWFVGRLILFINFLTLPKPIKRKEIEQDKFDKQTKFLSIYQFENLITKDF